MSDSKNRKSKIIILIFFINWLGIHHLFAQSRINYGLSFASHEVTTDLRTSLNLTPNDAIVLKGNFSISFDLSFNRNANTYGYIFRLIGNDNKSFDFISNSFTGPDHDLIFIDGGKETKACFDLNPSVVLKKTNWIHVNIEFDRKKQQVTIALDGKRKTDKIDLKKLDEFHLFFGANDYKKFSTADVPPMNIRNIQIKDEDVIKMNWLLKEHQQNKVFDLITTQYSEVKNASWIIDTHAKWQKRISFKTLLHPQIAYQADSGIIHVADKNGIYSYQVNTKNLKHIVYKNGSLIPIWSNQLIYDPYRKRLLQYDFENNRFNIFNKATQSWDLNERSKQAEPNFWHHNAFFSPLDSSLLTFGGYGFFAYKNNLQQFNFQNKQWKQITAKSVMMPRYLSAVGSNRNDSEVYFFGGYGNISGKQQLSPENLYDLQVLNLKDFSFRKIWKLNTNENNFVVSNSLKIDTLENVFYTLCFPRNKSNSFLYLNKFSLSKPEFITVGDSIPYPFQDTQSFADLYYCQQTNELIAITSNLINNKEAEVNIYSIAFPAIGMQMIRQQASQSATENMFWIIFFVSFLIFIVSGYIYWYYFKKTKNEKILLPVSNNWDDTSPKSNAIDTLLKPSINSNFKRQIKQSISLLGGLRLIDKNGNDIANQLTPILQHLLILILLFSTKNKKGISSKLMKEILWPDKSEESAKNNRGVNIRKLRLLLEPIGLINIISESTHWKIELQEELFCDYLRVNELIKMSEKLTEPELEELLELSKSGALLPDFNYVWLDDFKSDYSNEVIDKLINYTQNINPEVHHQQLMNISDIIFTLDPMNEDALILKCTLLKNQGKNAVAKNVYNSFCREFKIMMGEEYGKKFEDL